MNKFPLIFSLFFFTAIFVKAQNFGTIPLKQINNSVVFLREVRHKTIYEQGYEYEIGLRDPQTGVFYPDKTEYTGTGFTVCDGNAYVVTAKHLAENLTDSSFIKFSGATPDSLYQLKEVLVKFGDKRWYFADNIDIAIGIIKYDFQISKDTLYTTPPDTSRYLFDPVQLKTNFCNGIQNLDSRLISPFRDMDLVSIGYPHGIGKYKNPTSTVSKFFKASSEIIQDDETSPFFIIDDPSVDGLSGSPTFEASINFDTRKLDTLGFGIRHIVGKCVGMINGTYNDSNGGRFTRVIPSKLIVDEINRIKSMKYTIDYFHKNSQLWQELTVQNNVRIDVLCNYDKNGNPQEKGTLKNGNGTVYTYDEDGALYSIDEFKNSKFIKRIFQKK